MRTILPKFSGKLLLTVIAKSPTAQLSLVIFCSDIARALFLAQQKRGDQTVVCHKPSINPIEKDQQVWRYIALAQSYSNLKKLVRTLAISYALPPFGHMNSE